MSDLIQTTGMAAAMEMANAVMDSPNDQRVGQVIGGPGTGKTAVGLKIQKSFRAVRICAWAKMGRKAMLERLAIDLGCSPSGSADTLTARLFPHVVGRMIIIDEANHLKWDVIEAMRIFIDEYQAGLILIGTDLLEREFRSARTEIYLAQMAQRIGTKRVRLDEMTNVSEVTAYIIKPRFGDVTAKTAKEFLKQSRGNWRIAMGLVRAIEAVMRAEQIEKLDVQLIQTAGAWMARNN